MVQQNLSLDSININVSTTLHEREDRNKWQLV